MRLATYNILHGRSPGSRRVDPAAFAETVRRLDADVLALQEVDRRQPRSGRTDLTAVAAEATGATAQRYLPTLRGVVGSRRPATSDADSPAAGYGIALVSRHPVLEWRAVRLPRRPGVLWVRFGAVRRPVRDEPRAALVAVVDGPDGPFTAVCTHLSWLPGWGEEQLRVLVRELATLPRPLVLMGDLNILPDAAARAGGMRSLAEAPTYPSHAPVRQIDFVLGDGDIEPLGPASTVAGRSDHRALLVDVRLRPRRPAR